MSKDVAIRDTELDLVHLSPLICMELACGLSTPEGVMEKYEISEEQWLRLRGNPTFVKMMAEATVAFAGDMNAGKRIVKKAEILLEESLPILHRLVSAPEASSGTIVDVVKQLKEIAGIGVRGGQVAGGGGPGFNVSIEIHNSDPKKGIVIQGN